MVGQALSAGAPLQAVLFLDPVTGPETKELYQASQEVGVPAYVVSRGVFFRVLDLGYETATRVMGIVRAEPLDPSHLPDLVGPKAYFLVGERIQDPRNVGVLIRTAEALGARAAIFSADSADPYSRASVRSTTGSILRLPILLSDDLSAMLHQLRDCGVRLVGTSARAMLPCWEADLSPPCAIVMGNETTGLSEMARGACDVLIAITMQGQASSLNVTVAAGIILYEVERQARGRGAKAR